MTQSNRIGPISLAIFAGIIGLVLATCSLAHNIEGVSPRISAMPGTFNYFIQWTMEGGATIGLNMVALFGFTYATLLAVRSAYVKAFGLCSVALVAMLWSGTTQLGVIADKTFYVSGSKETAQRLYDSALAESKRLQAVMPSFHLFLDDAQGDLQTALAALKSHKYGNKTAWQTTKQCNADITATKSIELCRNYRRAKKALNISLFAAEINKKISVVNEVIKKGPPATIDGGPQMIAFASMGLLSVKNVQIILVFLRSFGIDLAAGLFLATAFSLWPSQAPRVHSRKHSQRVIDNLQKMNTDSERVHLSRRVQKKMNTEHAVLRALNSLSKNGEFNTTYRQIANVADIATGKVDRVLHALESYGHIERKSSKGAGTSGKVIVAEYV